jgi:hypothetical protein
MSLQLDRIRFLETQSVASAMVSWGITHGIPIFFSQVWRNLAGCWVLTSRQSGPEMRTIAIPALPGAVDSAYMVSSRYAPYLCPCSRSSCERSVCVMRPRVLWNGVERLGRRTSRHDCSRRGPLLTLVCVKVWNVKGFARTTAFRRIDPKDTSKQG